MTDLLTHAEPGLRAARDNSLHVHDQYTGLKTIWIDLSDRNDGEAVV